MYRPKAMRHGKGEKEKREGKERREEEKRGRKRDLKTPLGLRGYS